MSNRNILRIHSLSGILAGLFLLIISVTGSILCFKHEIRSALYPQLNESRSAEPANLQTLYFTLNKEFPEWCTTVITLPNEQSKSYTAKLISRSNSNIKLNVFYNSKGHWEVLPEKWLYYVEELHYYLLLPRYPGLVVAFILSTALSALTITGFYIYRKPIKKLLRFKRGLKFRTIANWHTSLGIVALAFNAIMATTAFLITFSGVFGGPRKTEFFQTSIPSGFELTTLSHKARELNPYKDQNLVNISFLNQRTLFHYEAPESKSGALGNYTRIFLDPANGKFISQGGKNENGIMKALNSSVSFHFGNFGGLFLKILYCLGGIFISLITLSGGLIYFQKKPKKAKVAKLKPAPQRTFKTSFLQGLRFCVPIIAIGFVSGALAGIFAGSLLKGGLYLTVILLFPILLNCIILLLAWVIYVPIRLVFRKKPGTIFKHYSTVSLGLFAGTCLWLILTGFVG